VERKRSVRPVPVEQAGPPGLECDVLVVGFGCAGASAAYEAAVAGADVLVLERASGHGGSSALSGGEVYLGGGTAGEVTTDMTGTGFEVTVTKSDGTTTEVHLDSSLNVFQGGPGGFGHG
jgi:succinate dehydrogenase/fumarate reductase flavoprotein subunit